MHSYPSAFKDNQQHHEILTSYHFNDFYISLLTFFLLSCVFSIKQISRKTSSILLCVCWPYFFLFLHYKIKGLGLYCSYIICKTVFSYLQKANKQKQQSEKQQKTSLKRKREFWKTEVLILVIFWPKVLPWLYYSSIWVLPTWSVKC